MSALPKTVLYPSKFLSSPAAGFDGVYDWSWAEHCYGKTKISPMDFDGVVERNAHFLVYETKDVGKRIDDGQRITLRNLFMLGRFSIFYVWGKTRFDHGVFVSPMCEKPLEITRIGQAQKLVARWFEVASSDRYVYGTTPKAMRAEGVLEGLHQLADPLIEKHEKHAYDPEIDEWVAAYDREEQRQRELGRGL